jgi:FKBP-type peptidyl-prolyl cis-trans isomerase SlyD
MPIHRRQDGAARAPRFLNTGRVRRSPSVSRPAPAKPSYKGTMSQQDQIAPGKVVTLKYTLTGEDGKILDQSGAEGIDYLHGAGNVVPGLETQMLGRAVGDKLKAIVAPADGYGERRGTPQKVPRTAFPDDVELEVGMEFMAEDPAGDPMPLWIVGVGKDDVEVDANHPLAGLTLTFDVEVLAIRPATGDEIAHGHPHGPDGHHHH